MFPFGILVSEKKNDFGYNIFGVHGASVQYYAPPNSLIDSTTSLNVKTTEG
jgi:hypothetical protein